MKGIKKLAFVLSTGYILMFYSELVFWSRYRPEADSFGGYLMIWAVYSVTSFAFLIAVDVFKARSIWALFLCGALYGWLTEGVVVQTMYNHESFPFYIFWTGLAWHALISILIGWYYVSKVLLENKPFKTVWVASAIGLFWGIWAVCWWVEEPGTSPGLLGFALFAFLSSLPVIVSYWLCGRLLRRSFATRKWQLCIIGILLVLYFVFVTLPAAPVAALILPPLLLIIWLTLRRNKHIQKRGTLLELSAGFVKPQNCLCLFFMPLVATVVYGVFGLWDVKVHTNWLIALVTTPTGAILFIISAVKIWRARPQEISISNQQSTLC